MPGRPTARPTLYGAGYVTGNIVGISKGSKNPEAAWELLKYLTTDTDALVEALQRPARTCRRPRPR